MVFRTARVPRAHERAGTRAVRKTGLKALLALGLSDTRYGVIVRTTRHMDPLLERQKSRKRNWPIITDVLDWMST